MPAAGCVPGREDLKMITRRAIQFITMIVVLSSVGIFAQVTDTRGLQEDSIGSTPPRLSLTTGDVSFWRPGAQDWSEARVNTPLGPGDLLYTGPQGNIEVQIGARAFVRGGPETQLGLDNHEPDYLQFRVTAGNASFDLRKVEPGRTVEVGTPHGVFTIEQDGYYRVIVNGDRTSFITRRGGEAFITYAGGETVSIGPSEEVTVEGLEHPRVASYSAPQLDEWDRWNYARTDHLLDAVSARYVSPGVYGVDDLDRHGTWRIVPTYGAVWVPRGMPAGWAPYSTGTWVMDPYYGWTWVDTAPWGWAPYHYGRWVFVSGYWAWAPGPVVVRPAYAPALVAFFGGPSAGVNISVGSGPVVGWVSLGWGEPCVPWWGPPTFRHRPWWGGWGGPRVVNNVVVHKTTVVNVQEISVYRNVSARNAVVVVRENHFGRGPVTSTRITHVDTKDLRPVRTEPRVTATPASYVPGERRGISPPRQVLDRSVVATRPPKARTELGFEKDRKGEPARVFSPTSRIVSAPRERESTPVRERPPYGRSEVERGTTDRARSPAPPKIESPRVRKQVSEAASPTTSQVQQQRESQGVGRPSAEAQAPRPRSEAGQARQPASPDNGAAQIRERELRGSPSAAPEESPRQGGSPEVRSTRERSQSSGSRTEVKRPPSNGLPGEPANRLAPPRVERKQRTERPQESQQGPARSMQQNGRRGR